MAVVDTNSRPRPFLLCLPSQQCRKHPRPLPGGFKGDRINIHTVYFLQVHNFDLQQLLFEDFLNERNYYCLFLFVDICCNDSNKTIHVFAQIFQK